MPVKALIDATFAPEPESAAPGPMLLTVSDAARVLAISRSKMYQLVTTRELEVVHIGRLVRVPLSSLHRFIARLEATGAGAGRSTGGRPSSSAAGMPTE